MVKELEIQMWEAAKAGNTEKFLKLVDKKAVMVCGGYRCTGSEYAGIISDFDCKAYEILHFETVLQTEDIEQVHYVIKTEVEKEENKDLEGTFHITSTWKKINGEWKLVFNMDSRIVTK